MLLTLRRELKSLGTGDELTMSDAFMTHIFFLGLPAEWKVFETAYLMNRNILATDSADGKITPGVDFNTVLIAAQGVATYEPQKGAEERIRGILQHSTI